MVYKFNKLLVLLFGLLLSQILLSKVAYVPLHDANLNLQPNHYILALDLEEGRVLKKVFVGEGVGPVFINKVGDKLYAAASEDHKIVQIDTKKLEITQDWQNLPIPPQQIILNSDETKIYFAQRDHNSIYQIDLSSGVISLALTITDFKDFHYSENLEFIVFRSYNSVNDEYTLKTYNLNQLSFLHQTTVTDEYPLLIDNSGLSYYISIFGYGQFQSRSLIDNQLNWYFYHGSGVSGPFGEYPEYFTSAHPLDNDTVLVIGSRGGSYEVNTNTGNGIKINDLTGFHHTYAYIENNQYLKSNPPSAVICPPIPVIPCDGFYPLELIIHDHQSNTEQLIYRRLNSGNLAKGRYIGQKLYSIPMVPTLNRWFIIILIMSILYFTTKSLSSVSDTRIKLTNDML